MPRSLNSLIDEDNTDFVKTSPEVPSNDWEETLGWQLKDGKVTYAGESQSLSPDSAFDSPHNHPADNGNEFKIKNGCCRECMKAFSSLKKACLCQVPLKQRRTQLPQSGCKYC